VEINKDITKVLSALVLENNKNHYASVVSDNAARLVCGAQFAL
jgi:hypothetical protein